MKKTLLFTLFAFSVLSLEAQDAKNNDLTGREKLMQGIKKEKFRTPVKISEALKAGPESGKGLMKTTGSPIEKKLTTNAASGTDEGEAFIALNPAAPAQLVMSFMEESAGSIRFPVYFSNDSGNNWTKSTFNPLTVLGQDFPGGFVIGGGDPVFAYDNNGKLYFSWIYLALNQSQDTAFAAMYWASSLNNGQTWTLAPGNDHFIGIGALDPFTQDFIGAEGFYDRQWFTVDRSSGSFSGQLYASFLYIPTSLESSGNVGTWVRHFNTGTNTWSAKAQVFSGVSQFANPSVDANGILHVAFADIDNELVLHASSADGGQTFSAPHLVYSGTNLFGAQSSFTHVHQRENSATSLAIDGDNILHMVWSDFDNVPAGYSSFYSRSSNGGVTWSTPLNLSALLPGSLNSLMPVVSAYDKKVTIGMYGLDAGNISDYYTITSLNNGVAWDTAKKASAQSTGFNLPSNFNRWFGDYFNAARTNCKVYNVWSDGRGAAGPKMYVSVTNDCNTLDIPEITPVNASFAITNIYPVPARTNINLEISSSIQNELKLDIYQVDGKLLQSTDRTIVKGEQVISWRIDSLPAGTYLLTASSGDGYKYSRLIRKN